MLAELKLHVYGFERPSDPLRRPLVVRPSIGKGFKKLEGNGPIDSRALDIGKKMISYSKYALIFDISIINYPDVHLHLVSNRQPLRPWRPPNSLSSHGGQI